ncbi:MAG: HAD family hydrolase [Bacilli bacterium]|nr:HAD family hydrolase [Bacilli bacterium]
MDKKKVLIIFDCFGVLYGRVVLPYLESLFYPEDAKSRLNLYTYPTDHGRGHFTDIAKWIEQDSGIPYEESIAKMKELSKANRPLFSYIRENLHDKVYVGLLSNCARGQLEFVAEEGLHPASIADLSLLSYHTGLTKPDFRFYEKLIEMFKIDFEEIYMVDDSLENIEALENTKIKGIHYKNNKELFKKLDEILNK